MTNLCRMRSVKSGFSTRLVQFFSSLSLALVVLTAGAAAGPPTGVPGSIVVTDREVSSGPNMKDDLKQFATTALTQTDEAWKVHFVAYLNRVAGSEQVNVVFYDAAASKPGQPKQPVNDYQINIARNGRVVMASVVLRPDDGFKPGSKYNMLVTRLVNGKEDVYAKTTIELK